jgi:hypothetical protein
MRIIGGIGVFILGAVIGFVLDFSLAAVLYQWGGWGLSHDVTSTLWGLAMVGVLLAPLVGGVIAVLLWSKGNPDPAAGNEQ